MPNQPRAVRTVPLTLTLTLELTLTLAPTLTLTLTLNLLWWLLCIPIASQWPWG